jgi:hypothetical protein
VLVTGAAAQDREWEAQLAATPRRALEKTGRDGPNSWPACPLRTLKQRLAQLKDDTVVLVAGYFRDGDGRDFTPREAVLRLVAVSGAPIYGVLNPSIGTAWWAATCWISGPWDA